jgi:hypothetical protein
VDAMEETDNPEVEQKNIVIAQRELRTNAF